MSKSPRKSIVASFGLLSAELESDQAADQQQPSQAPDPVPGNRVGAGVIGAAHRAIDDIRTERDRLKAIVESGGGAVRELDPSLIDPSPYPDRLPDDDTTSFEAFKRSIETEGQKVPVQVRKHPSSPGRYQIVYGHRRWLAAMQLDRPVRALEVEISDLDLVLAQGIENAGRQDLTWIERALFASRMDDAGIKPRHIYAALSIEDAELARMRNVYRIIPTDIIEAIGRAPKIGRPRWLDLAKTVAGNAGTLDTLRAALDRKGDVETSDQRFQRALNAIKPASTDRRAPSPITDKSGTKLGALLMSSKEVRISAEGSLGVEFLKFVEAELPALTERFARLRENEKP
ncbi:Plasmid partitioning protein RepB (plasmid) [Neorhizobium galegae bv. officinalis bv. officinalis str. HAMBI 1141]|uniref:Plasmid partitioning protein RepB n=1 Tax=Neorhizobium galegae bv. officinalis bv. officinalis str. HAMBI 1141 TaxID=1028801 RepID=A0A068TL96_NEOGA|nr:plasmid partitioning protein RepB [Neorhizobium galegae]CDN58350.1 Plasmid partitioning protein RepB [Neorhizobium galegae bv. officinalis bv. officinalis str. HAMBI 1141]